MILDKKRRIGIFTFYDANGIADLYIDKMLDSISGEIDKLVIIVNGEIKDNSRKRIKKFSEYIFERDNMGFDAGAYRDAFLIFMHEENWERWDEIVLFNDTFYGPVFPWIEVFSKMDKIKNIDFWGLSRYMGGKIHNKGLDYASHIQSYFLACRRTVFLSPLFWKFWQELDYPVSRQDATKNFEVRFTVYFTEKGFRSIAYTEVCDKKINAEKGESLYYIRPYELLKEIRFPVLKRKSLVVTNYIRAKQALNYIENNTEYDIELIYEHQKRLAKEKRIALINPFELERFCNVHRKIFIYGYGEFGKNIAAYMESRNWKYEGFIVSEKKNADIRVFSCKDIVFTKDMGVILALGDKACKEVYPLVKEKLDEKQILRLNC